MNVGIFDLICGARECVCVCVFLSEISVCGHDVRGVGQSNRTSGDRLQMGQRHVCVNLGEYYGAANGHR